MSNDTVASIGSDLIMETDKNIDLATPYAPRAIYYETSDVLEYVRADEPAFYRRIDKFLTLVISIDSNQLLGIKLKGFRHIYIEHIKSRRHQESPNFVRLISVLEDIVSVAANSAFEEVERRQAYNQALEIAREDDVRLVDLPRAVAH